MNAVLIEQVAELILKLAPTIFATANEAIPLAADLIAKIKSDKPPTDADWASLHTIIDAKTAAILEQLPEELP